MFGNGESSEEYSDGLEAEEMPVSMLSLTVGSMPGLLTLSPSRAEKLIACEPLHHTYTIENQPFAR